MTNAPAFRVQPSDPQYIADAVAEGVFFDTPQYFTTHLTIALPIDSPLEAHNNTRLTGDPRTRWFETIHPRGPFRRGLFYGVTAQSLEGKILELNPELHLTFLDISQQSLQRRQDDLGVRFPGRVSTAFADLNFAELEENAYDVIVSMSTLHHLQNIEWAAYQINRALAPGGWFFLHDYVGEDRFMWSETRRQLIESLITIGKRRGDVPQSWAVQWPVREPWNYSPFEAIRCEDTLDILRGTLDEVSVATAGGIVSLHPLISMSADDERRWQRLNRFIWKTRPHALWRRMAAKTGRRLRPAMSEQFMHDLLLLDTLALDNDLVLPMNAFGVYRKRA